MFFRNSRTCLNKSGQVADFLQNSSEFDQNQSNLFKIGESKKGIKYVVHTKYVPENEKILTEAFANMSNKEEITKSCFVQKLYN